MAYPDRDWDNTGTKVTKEDFKRIEGGIKTNDAAITEQANQINVLNNERGYLNTKVITDANLATENGIYLIDTGASNSPNSSWAFFIENFKQVGYNNGFQIATAFFPTSVPFMYMRKCTNGDWTTWELLATTKNMGVDFQNGWTKKYGDCNPTLYKVGNVVTLTAVVSNLSNISNGGIIMSLPAEAQPNSNLVFKAVYENNTFVTVKVLLNGTVVVNFDYTANQAIFLNLSWARA